MGNLTAVTTVCNETNRLKKSKGPGQNVVATARVNLRERKMYPLDSGTYSDSRPQNTSDQLSRFRAYYIE